MLSDAMEARVGFPSNQTIPQLISLINTVNQIEENQLVGLYCIWTENLPILPWLSAEKL